MGDWQQYFMSIIGETETGKNSQFQSSETVQMSEDTLKFTPFFFTKIERTRPDNTCYINWLDLTFMNETFSIKGLTAVTGKLPLFPAATWK